MESICFTLVKINLQAQTMYLLNMLSCMELVLGRYLWPGWEAGEQFKLHHQNEGALLAFAESRSIKTGRGDFTFILEAENLLEGYISPKGKKCYINRFLILKLDSRVGVQEGFSHCY